MGKRIAELRVFTYCIIWDQKPVLFGLSRDFIVKIKKRRAPSQGAGVSRHTLSHCTTIRRNTTNNETHPELYRSPTTRDLKKLCSSRCVGGA